MKKRFNKILILLLLFSLIIPQSVFADNPALPQNSGLTTVKQLVMCYADCWRNSSNNWTDITGYDGTVYPRLQPGTIIPGFRIQIGYMGNLSGTPQLVDVEPAPSVISQDLYDSFNNKDSIEIANTGYGAPIPIPDLEKLNRTMLFAGTIDNTSSIQNGNNAVVILNNVDLTTTYKDEHEAVPPGISGQYLANHTGNAPTVQGRRIFFPLIATWKVQQEPDFKVWIGCDDMTGKQPGEPITINCSVKNLGGTTVPTDIGVAEYGLGWNPPTIHGPLVDIPISGTTVV